MNEKKQFRDKEVEDNFIQISEDFQNKKPSKLLLKSYNKLLDIAYEIAIPFDTKFNAIHWAIDVFSLLNQIQYSYCWMKSYAKYYKNKVDKSSRMGHENFQVSYYADNSIVRIDSCCDKLALMVWAYYVPFNPEKKREILNLEMILERLKTPLKHGLKIKSHENFYKSLKKLKNKHLSEIEKYRHLKIHRREPRIELYGIEDHHDWSYMILLDDEKSIKKFDEDLEKQYTDNNLRESVKKSCYIDNVLFDQRRIDRMIDYNDLEKNLDKSLLTLIEVATECFNTLKKKAPFNKRKKVF